jgi:dephospho-CoA kinase
MLKIGVTGGIGSGKSMVCQILESFGYPVFYSDDEAKKLSDSHPKIRKDLIQIFGQEVYDGSGLNRPFLASKIFDNEEDRQRVNAIIHPVVRKTFEDFANSTEAPFVFNEAAILIETGAHENFDAMILVSAPQEIRLKRVIRRDSSNSRDIEARMEKQWTDEQKRPFANFEIMNDGERPLLVQVEELIAYLTSSHGS